MGYARKNTTSKEVVGSFFGTKADALGLDGDVQGIHEVFDADLDLALVLALEQVDHLSQLLVAP